MTEGCAVCRRAAGQHDATLVDKSGGTVLQLCDSCLGWLVRRQDESRLDDHDQTLCAICMVPVDQYRRAEQLVDCHAPPRVAADVCDDCRHNIVFGDEIARQRATASTGTVKP